MNAPLQIMHLLIQAGGSDAVVLENDDGNTALHLAAATGDQRICQLLINAKARLDVAGEDGDTVRGRKGVCVPV